MSLVLLVHTRDFGIIGTDGRICTKYDNGQKLPVGNFQQKFRFVGGWAVLFGTGSSVLVDTVIDQAVRTIVKIRHRHDRYRKIVELLESQVRTVFDQTLDGAIKSLSIGVLAFDSEAGRVRSTSWIDQDTFQTIHTGINEWNIGVYGEDARTVCDAFTVRLQKLIVARTTGRADILNEMQALLSERAASSVTLNDRLFWCHVMAESFHCGHIPSTIPDAPGIFDQAVALLGSNQAALSWLHKPLSDDGHTRAGKLLHHGENCLLSELELHI